MKALATCAFALAFLAGGTRISWAADAPVVLTLDQRPIDRKGGVAVTRGTTVFADAVDLTKAFNGLLLFSRGPSVKIDIGGTLGTFRVGSNVATINGKRVALPSAPFVRNGDIYVPVRVLARLAGAKVTIDGALRHADIVTPATRVSSGMRAPHASAASSLTIVPAGSIAADGLHVSVTLTNSTKTPYTLSFTSGNQIAFIVERDGVQVWDSTAGKRFTQALRPLTFAPGEAKTFSDVWTQFTSVPGRYMLRVRVQTSPPFVSSPVSVAEIVPSPSPTR